MVLTIRPRDMEDSQEKARTKVKRKTPAKKRAKKTAVKKAVKKTVAKKTPVKTVAKTVDKGGRPKGSGRVAASPDHSPTMRTLAARLARDLTTIRDWNKEPDCPGRDQTNQFHVPSWLEWIDRTGKNFKDISAEGKSARARKVEFEAKIQEIKLKQLEGRSVDIEEAVEVFGKIVMDMAQGVLQMAKTHSSRIAGQDAGTVERIVHDLGRSLLTKVAIPEEKKKPQKEGDSSLFWTNVCACLSDRLKS